MSDEQQKQQKKKIEKIKPDAQMAAELLQDWVVNVAKPAGIGFDVLLIGADGLTVHVGLTIDEAGMITPIDKGEEAKSE